MGEKYVVCDTDVLIEYYNQKSSRFEETKFNLENQIGLNNIIISVITAMEILAGADNKREEKKLEKFLSRFRLSLLNESISKDAFIMFKKYKLSHGMAIPDCLIASTARILDLPLYSYNFKDFKFVDNLNLFKAAK